MQFSRDLPGSLGLRGQAGLPAHSGSGLFAEAANNGLN